MDEFIDIVGEYLDPIICQGLGERCYKAAATNFAMMCPNCAMTKTYVFCHDHAEFVRKPGLLFRFNDDPSGCDHQDHNPYLKEPLPLVFILTEESVLNTP